MPLSTQLNMQLKIAAKLSNAGVVVVVVSVVNVVIVELTLFLMLRSFLFIDFWKNLLHHLFHIVVFVGRRWELNSRKKSLRS